MAQGVAVKEHTERLSKEGSERAVKEKDGRISLSRLMGMLRRRRRRPSEGKEPAAQDSQDTATGATRTAIVAQLEADIAELEKRLRALEADGHGEPEQTRMLHLLLRNRKDVLERAKARKFLLDGASYGVK